jgi:O-antigen ligase
VSIIIIFLNLLFANSRTPLIATVFGLAVFFLLSLNLKAKVAIVIYGTIIFMMISNVPFIQSKIDSSVDIFVSGGQKTEGSTVEMRKRQLAASIKVFKQSPVFGNGLYYIKENLGYISAEKNSSAEDFDGFESYAYNLLIEQGLVGILANIIFFGCLSVYFLKNLAVSKQFAGLGFAIVVLFLIYNIGTGPLNSWIMTMALFGILIGSINFSINFNKVLKGLIEHYVN